MMYHFMSLLTMISCISLLTHKGVKRTKDRIDQLVPDVSQRLLTHMLNRGKTELQLIFSKYMHLKLFPPLQVHNDVIPRLYEG